MKKAQGPLKSHQRRAEVRHHKSECASTAATRPSQLCLRLLSFHPAKRLMCFPESSRVLGCFSNCFSFFSPSSVSSTVWRANQIPICSLNHMPRHMFQRLLDNASALCFCSRCCRPSSQLFTLSRHMRNCDKCLLRKQKSFSVLDGMH